MKTTTLLTVKRIKSELHLSHLFQKDQLSAALVSGTLIGLMTSILSISFAVLVFGKAIPEALPIGIGMALFSNVILHLGSAFFSSGEGVIAHVQSLPPPIQAAMLSSLMSVLPISMSVENRIVIAVITMLLSAVFTGGILFFLGWLKLGRLVRFLPLPVVSGFLASVGFALVFGGIATMTRSNVTLSSLSQLFSETLLLKWWMGIVLAAVLWIVMARWKHVLVFPTLLGIAVALFYAICFIKGLTINDLMIDNLLLGPFPKEQSWQPTYFYFNQINTFDWSIMRHQIGIMATIPLVCFIGGLLMLSAIEFSTGRQIEPNFELKTMGASNIVSGVLGGGFVGYPSTTFTVMQDSLGAKNRLAGILSAFIPLIIIVLGTHFLGYIPRFIIGGLLIYFGYQFIEHWVIKQIKQSSLSNLSIIAAIVVTSLCFGFVASVATGVLVAVGIFIFQYTQTSVIRYVSSGAMLRSRVIRNSQHDDWLLAHADSIAIYGLQGFIFFGTAHSLPEEIMKRVTDTQQTPLDSVILDFRHVTGIDSSVIQNFHKLYLQLQQKNIVLLFAQMPSMYQEMMQKVGLDKTRTKGFSEFSNLDEALEWRENYLLENSDLPHYQFRPMLTVFSEHFNDAAKAAILLQYLKRIALSPKDKIIQQDTVANDLFFVQSGRLSAYLEQDGHPPIRLQTVVDDTIVGEIGFYLGELRTATVIVEAPSIVYRLSRCALAQLEKDHPNVALALHKLMVEKTAKRLNYFSNSVKGLM
jgi:sulfate permease, SulP family